MLKFSTYGDWSRAGVVLRNLSKHILPAFKVTIDKDGELIRERLVGHINAQDLSWKPLAQKTIELKGHNKIYIETGSLKNGIVARRIRAPKNGYSLFIGCNAWEKNSKGSKLSDIMIYLEYGTSKIPARPLIRPTWEELRGQIKDDLRKTLKGLIRGEIGG